MKKNILWKASEPIPTEACDGLNLDTSLCDINSTSAYDMTLTSCNVPVVHSIWPLEISYNTTVIIDGLILKKT